MKLLFDENISPRLVDALSDLYPELRHVTSCGLRGKQDTAVWQFARENGFIIVSKDSDFSQRSSLLGHPPKVIWLRIGNCSTQRLGLVMRNTKDRIEAFTVGEESCLVLVHPRA